MSEQSLTIIGCGLIGSSIGLALKRRQPNWFIAGLDLSDNLPSIQEAGFADVTGTLEDAPQVLPQSRLVILATPVEVILEQLAQVTPYLTPGTVVTDVGGTKQAIVAQAERTLPKEVVFIGGHPIAGSENAGVQAADPLLFKERVYVLCPTPNTPPDALLMLLDLVEELMAVPLTLEPEEHDAVLAMVSHVPQLLSIAMVHAAMQKDSLHSLLEMTAGGGFLDLTRIAASGFEQWKGVLSTNRSAIADALDQLTLSIQEVREAIDQDDLEGLWSTVSTKRRALTPHNRPKKRKPDLRTFIDQYDERILKALSDRMRAVTLMGKLKQSQGAPVHDPDRERRMIAARQDWGKALGLPEDLIEALFNVLVTHSKKKQVG
ncbi:MAG: prephenate dehydrogenase/arogenate dehydrogenase family protein [Myxococcota bacterium]|nr:prephenate dehydrogenase/arogenate dehydrogenase family protein [Myxococcota bacterium]